MKPTEKFSCKYLGGGVREVLWNVTQWIGSTEISRPPHLPATIPYPQEKEATDRMFPPCSVNKQEGKQVGVGKVDRKNLLRALVRSPPSLTGDNRLGLEVFSGTFKVWDSLVGLRKPVFGRSPHNAGPLGTPYLECRNAGSCQVVELGLFTHGGGG